jgi:hypothetical protein
MELFIPKAAIHAGIIVGSLVYVVCNTAGEITGLFVSKTSQGTSYVVGGAVGAIAGSFAGVLTAEAIKTATDGYFVPAVKTGSRLSGLGISVGAGAATVVVVSLAMLGSRFVVNAIRHAQKQDFTPIDYTLYVDNDFSVLQLEAIVGNPTGEKGDKN